MANKHMERCSTSLIIKEMQIKMTMRYYLTPIRMAVTKKKKERKNKLWQGCGEIETLAYCWCECRMVYKTRWEPVQEKS